MQTTTKNICDIVDDVKRNDGNMTKILLQPFFFMVGHNNLPVNIYI